MPSHPADDNADDNADTNTGLGLAINLKGSAVLSVRGRDVILGDQDAMLGSRIAVERMVAANPKQFRILRIPGAATLQLLAGEGDAIAGPIPRGSSPLQLLVRYLDAIRDKELPAMPELQSAVIAHIRDLVDLVIGQTRDASGFVKNHSMRRARLRAIKIDILANIKDGKLSLNAVAARQGITASYIRKLFQSEGTSFTAFVLDQRLLEAQRMLTNPRFADLSISQVALNIGFHDQSYFNRTFRRRFGQTPSKTRLAALRKHGSNE
jgi:AraC-like DNA-binding protein